MLVLTPEMRRLYREHLRPEGWGVGEEAVVPEGPPVLRLPALRRAWEKPNLPLAMGVILLGAAARILGVREETLTQAVREVLGKKRA